jgi:hypothetical protein
VAWVSERKDLLCVFFGLLTLLAYLRYVQFPTRAGLVLVCIPYVLAIMSKPMLVTLPFALLLLDAWPLGRLRSSLELPALVREKFPLFIIAALSCLMTGYAQIMGGAVRSLHEAPWDERLGGIAVSCVVYLGKTFNPTSLAVFYPAEFDRPLWQPLAATALIVIVTALAVWLRKRVPALLVGWLWFLGSLVPVIGLVRIGEIAYADRYTYWPHIGLFLFLVWGAAELANLCRIPILVRVAAMAVVLAFCAIQTREQISYWHDSRALWDHAIVVSPQAAYPRVVAAKAIRASGDLDTALRYCEEALAVEPEFFEAMLLYASILQQQGRWK